MVNNFLDVIHQAYTKAILDPNIFCDQLRVIPVLFQKRGQIGI